MRKEYYTTAQVCDLIAMSKSTVMRMVEAGSFPKPTIVGKSNRWHVTWVERWIDENESKQHGNLKWHLGKTFPTEE